MGRADRDRNFIAKVAVIFDFIIAKINAVVILCIGIRFHQIAGEFLSDLRIYRTFGCTFILEELNMNVIPAVMTVAAEDDLLRHCFIGYAAVTCGSGVCGCFGRHRTICADIIPHIGSSTAPLIYVVCDRIHFAVAASAVKVAFGEVEVVGAVAVISPSEDETNGLCSVRRLYLPDNILCMSCVVVPDRSAFIVVYKTLPDFVFANEFTSAVIT